MEGVLSPSTYWHGPRTSSPVLINIFTLIVRSLPPTRLTHSAPAAIISLPLSEEFISFTPIWKVISAGPTYKRSCAWYFIDIFFVFFPNQRFPNFCKTRYPKPTIDRLWNPNPFSIQKTSHQTAMVVIFGPLLTTVDWWGVGHTDPHCKNVTAIHNFGFRHMDHPFV